MGGGPAICAYWADYMPRCTLCNDGQYLYSSSVYQPTWGLGYIGQKHHGQWVVMQASPQVFKTLGESPGQRENLHFWDLT